MMLPTATSNIVKSFRPIFYISKYFGCNLYPLPNDLNASNVKMNLRVIDVLLCLFQLILSFGVTIPLLQKWETDDSPMRKELESKITSSGVIILNMTGSVANYGYSFLCLVIMFIDMINASVVRSILLSFINFDKLVRKYYQIVFFSSWLRKYSFTGRKSWFEKKIMSSIRGNHPCIDDFIQSDIGHNIRLYAADEKWEWKRYNFVGNICGKCILRRMYDVILCNLLVLFRKYCRQNWHRK